MKKFLLSSWLKIMGIAAASGIAYENNQLILVSDTGNALYHYFIENDSLSVHSLDNKPIEHHQHKDHKYDLEALTIVDNTWYAFGSGSKPNRNTAFYFNKFSKYSTPMDLTDLYDEMKVFSELSEQDFNIEAALHHNDNWYFLNRGNGPENANYLFVIQGRNFTDDFNIYYFKFDLPPINDVSSGFSAATLHNNTLFFLATAEDEESTYVDGEIKGSMIGAIDLKKMKLLFTEKISDTHKFEGLTIVEQDKKKITFALCEDADDATNTESVVYKLEVELKSRVK